MELKVECYAGYRGEEIPRRFTLDHEEIEISIILQRSRTPSHRIFKVLGSNGFVYLLSFHENNWQWEIEPVG